MSAPVTYFDMPPEYEEKMDWMNSVLEKAYAITGEQRAFDEDGELSQGWSVTVPFDVREVLSDLREVVEQAAAVSSDPGFTEEAAEFVREAKAFEEIAEDIKGLTGLTWWQL